jgi:hypothetical protein
VRDFSAISDASCEPVAGRAVEFFDAFDRVYFPRQQ